jgi:hypothetical protein
VDSWDVVYYEDADGNVPAADFLLGCPAKTQANLLAVLNAVAAAPPPAFSGGGKWEAMHGKMGGYYEIRAMGPGREHFRLFCILDKADDQKKGLPRDAIAVIAGVGSPTPHTSMKVCTRRFGRWATITRLSFRAESRLERI